MTKNQFIKTLRASLRGLPPAQMDDITADYEEYFRDGAANGRSEEQIADGLGDPTQIAKELLCEMRIQAWETKKSFGNLGRVLLAVVALGGLNLFLSIPMLLIMCLMTASYVVAASLILVGLAALLSYIPGLDFLVRFGPELDAVKTAANAARTAEKEPNHIVIDKDGKHIEINGGNVTTTDANGRSVQITKDGSGHVEIHVQDPKKGKDIQISGKNADDDAGDDDDDADDAASAADAAAAGVENALSRSGIDVDLGFLNDMGLGLVRAVTAVGGLLSGGILLLINLWVTRLLVSWFLRYAKLNYSLIKGD